MIETQKRVIRALEDGLPFTDEPFKRIAEVAGLTEAELIAQLEAWKADGTIRRFGAILRHQQAGFPANAMGVWDVPDARVEQFGRAAVRFREISHCYQRPRFYGFPYNVYTMIHGRSREDCEDAARAVAAETGITDYTLLYTTAEFKKSSPVYFAGDPEDERRGDLP